MNADPGPGHERRAALLAELGAEGAIRDELLAYLENPYSQLLDAAVTLPLAEEPQIAHWRLCVTQATREGVLPTLRRCFPQLSFPIAEGISREPAYRSATRRGEWDPESPGGLELSAPGSLELTLDDGPAGPVPVLVVWHRPDFVALVQALTCRNEPEPVPAAMGACLVKGIADWERVRLYRQEWERRRGHPASEAEWAAEMKEALAPRKELWQDRLILLSGGPYSAVGAVETNLTESGWREASLAIRRAHESFHYLTLRLTGAIRSHLLDELLADFTGLFAAFGRYDPWLALRFLGLDRLPELRPEGRITVYRESLGAEALTLLAELVARAARNLADLDLSEGGADPIALPARPLIALAVLGLDGLAGNDLPMTFAATLATLEARAGEPASP